jgi:hypothetical protein
MHREGPPDTRLFTRGSSAVLALILLLALAVRFSMMAHAAAFPGFDGGLVPILFVLGSLRCFIGLRRGVPLLPLVVVSQLLLYVALDGAVFRYRYPLQPVITLLACAGLTLMTSTVWSWAADCRFVPRKLFAGVDGVVSLPRSLRA